MDDIFRAFESTIDTVFQFYEHINSCHEHLKFTLNPDIQQISFLDILGKSERRYLITDLYVKDTDKFSYMGSCSIHFIWGKKPPH